MSKGKPVAYSKICEERAFLGSWALCKSKVTSKQQGEGGDLWVLFLEVLQDDALGEVGTAMDRASE